MFKHFQGLRNLKALCKYLLMLLLNPVLNMISCNRIFDITAMDGIKLCIIKLLFYSYNFRSLNFNFLIDNNKKCLHCVNLVQFDFINSYTYKYISFKLGLFYVACVIIVVFMMYKNYIGFLQNNKTSELKLYLTPLLKFY